MSAVGKKWVAHELKDAAIYPLTADGAALTYGSKVDIPGAIVIELSPGEVRSVTLQGDAKIHDIHSKVLSYRVRVRMSSIDADVFAAITGGTAATSGTTPNTTASFTAKGADLPGYFKVAGLSTKAKDFGSENGANDGLTLYKCKMVSPPVYAKSNDGLDVSWEAVAIPTTYDDKIKDEVFYETAATLS